MISAILKYETRSYSMEQLYKMIGTSRQWYAQYQSRNSDKEILEHRIVEIVKKWREQHPQMGSRPMFYSLLAAGKKLEIGVNKFEKIVSSYNLNTTIVR